MSTTEQIESKNSDQAPSLIFIVPYRDREPQLNVFRIMMKYLLEDYDPASYEICISHQQDKRPFNRGAMKNLGFISMRNKYPNTYKGTTFVFHDVDTYPCFKNVIDYRTTHGNVKHFYGFEHTLGGIVSITGSDFEKTNGFPCYWSYGYEDNVFQTRVLNSGLKIDRSVFFKIGNPFIFQSVDHFVKNVNKNWRQTKDRDNGTDGVSSIMNVVYREDNGFVNFVGFEPAYHPLSSEKLAAYDLMHNKYLSGRQMSASGTGNTPVRPNTSHSTAAGSSTQQESVLTNNDLHVVGSTRGDGNDRELGESWKTAANGLFLGRNQRRLIHRGMFRR